MKSVKIYGFYKFALKISAALLLCLVMFGQAHAQSIPVLEQRYNSLIISLQKEDSTLTVLKNMLENRAKQIDYEKKKSSQDKQRIAELMSNSISLSGQVEAQQRKVEQISGSLESVKYQLNVRYNSVLDSLKNLRKSSAAQKSGDLDASIMFYMGKKLTVAPRLPRQSFNPDKIRAIDPNSGGAGDKALYVEYLKGALSETELQLSNVNDAYNETEQIIRLQRKTKRFLEEAESEREMRAFPGSRGSSSTNTQSSTGNQGGYGGKDGGTGDHMTQAEQATRFPAEANTLAQLQSYAFLYRQLKPEQSPDILRSLKNMQDNSSRKISVKDYFSLLKELKKSLEDYRSMLQKKLGQ